MLFMTLFVGHLYLILEPQYTVFGITQCYTTTDCVIHCSIVIITGTVFISLDPVSYLSQDAKLLSSVSGLFPTEDWFSYFDYLLEEVH